MMGDDYTKNSLFRAMRKPPTYSAGWMQGRPGMGISPGYSGGQQPQQQLDPMIPVQMGMWNTRMRMQDAERQRQADAANQAGARVSGAFNTMWSTAPKDTDPAAVGEAARSVFGGGTQQTAAQRFSARQAETARVLAQSKANNMGIAETDAAKRATGQAPPHFDVQAAPGQPLVSSGERSGAEFGQKMGQTPGIQYAQADAGVSPEEQHRRFQAEAAYQGSFPSSPGDQPYGTGNIPSYVQAPPNMMQGRDQPNETINLADQRAFLRQKLAETDPKNPMAGTYMKMLAAVDKADATIARHTPTGIAGDNPDTGAHGQVLRYQDLTPKELVDGGAPSPSWPPPDVQALQQRPSAMSAGPQVPPPAGFAEWPSTVRPEDRTPEYAASLAKYASEHQFKSPIPYGTFGESPESKQPLRGAGQPAGLADPSAYRKQGEQDMLAAQAQLKELASRGVLPGQPVGGGTTSGGFRKGSNPADDLRAAQADESKVRADTGRMIQNERTISGPPLRPDEALAASTAAASAQVEDPTRGAIEFNGPWSHRMEMMQQRVARSLAQAKTPEMKRAIAGKIQGNPNWTKLENFASGLGDGRSWSFGDNEEGRSATNGWNAAKATVALVNAALASASPQ
jgi:hypothetical protein